jgi:RHS repeat-associated protein
MRKALAVAILALFATTVRAQITNVADDTIPPIPGAGHDYIHMLSETVNPANGTVSLKITMPTPKGRGISLPFSLTYNSGAALHFAAWAPDQAGFAEQVTPPTGGWGTSLPYLSFGQTSYNFPYGDGLPGSPAETCFFTTGYMFYDSSGGHALQLAAMSPPPFSTGYCWQMNNQSNGQIPAFTPENSGSDSQVEATFPQPCAQASYTVGAMPTSCNSAEAEVDVFDGAGTIYYFGSSGGTPTNSIGSSDSFAFWPTKMEDRNGNIINFSVPNGGLAVTDTAGRALVTMNNPNPGALVFAPTVITAGGLTYDLTYQTQPAPTFSLTGSQEELPTSVPTGITCGINFLPTATAPDVIKTISLPNGQKYTFSYDSTYGLLSEIQYPDGGWVKYTWKLSDTFSEDAIFTGLYNNLPVQQGCNMLYKTPVVATRQVSFNGSSVAQTQSFTYNTNWNTGSTDNYWTTKTTTVQTTDAVRELTSQTIYSYSPVGQNPIPGFQGQGINASQIAVEQNVQHYDWGNTTTPIETVTEVWSDQFNLASKETTLNGTSTSEVTYQYGFGGAVTEKQEYDFGSGAPGTLLRTTVNTYQTFPANPRFPLNTPGFPATISTLQTFPCQSIVYIGAVSSANRDAETDVEYDGGTSVCGASGSASTVSASVPTGTHDETCYGPGLPTPRGNATTIIKQCFPSCTNAVTTYAYNETGQIVSKTDPCGNTTCSDMTGTNHTTTYSYIDSYTSGTPPSNTNAYLTRVTRPTTSNGVSHISNYSYRYLDGQLTVAKDENGQSTTYAYADSLDRLTAVGYPDKGQTTYAYNDVPPTPSVTTTKLATPDPTITSVSTRDGLGHVTQTQITSVSPVISSNTTFDGLGRVYTVSNPHVSTGSPTDGTMIFTVVDAIGRTLKVTEQDNSTVSTAYSGNVTTVTDEAGNTRTTTTNGLGHISEVQEGPLALDYLTFYSFDALDNLTHVTQGHSGSRMRSFVYDSLSRLSSTANPENGTISTSYDANGNVQTRTDARGIVTTYTNDTLNRVTQQAYSDGVTPTVSFLYDTASTNGVVLANPIGRLSLSYNNVVESLFSYDPVGRVVTYLQTTPQHNAIAFSPSYTYDLAGNITSFANGLAVTFSYSYDGAGRTTLFTSSLSDANHPATLATVNSSTGFWPTGAIREVTFGNGLTQTSVFNNRLQPCRLNVNSSATALVTCADAIPSGSVQDFNYGFKYGTTDNGNVVGWTATGQQSFNRSYTYDQVNRLKTLSDTATNQACKGLAWVYDEWGNRTEQNVTSGSCLSPQTPVNTNNQLTVSGYTYDAAGNLTHDANHSYTYDAENRLTKVDGGSTATYTYDAIGHRVEKTVPGEYFDYLYDLAGNVEGEWLTSSGYTGGLAEYGYMDGALTAEYYAGTTYFIHKDHLGSTRLVTGVTQSLIDNMDYLPFGEQIAGGTSITHKFTSKERDSESNLDNFGARYNSSSLGRFMSPDPMHVMGQKMADPQQWNMYIYVRDNPLRMVDPNGKWPTEIHNEIIDKAFPGLSARQRDVLKSASYKMDHCMTCQSEGNSYQHSMRAPSENPADAKQKANDFIGTEEHMAQGFQKATPADASKINDRSLSMFGNAAHTVADGTSPAHVDAQGNPLPWDEFSPSAVKAHKEAESTISPDEMDAAINALRKAFQNTYGQTAEQQAATPPQPATCAPNSACP